MTDPKQTDAIEAEKRCRHGRPFVTSVGCELCINAQPLPEPPKEAL